MFHIVLNQKIFLKNNLFQVKYNIQRIRASQRILNSIGYISQNISLTEDNSTGREKNDVKILNVRRTING